MSVQAPKKRATWHDAFAAQIEQWEFVRTSYGQRVLAKWAQIESDRQPTKARVYEGLLHAEEAKLFGADPFFVSAEMCDVIEAASESFAPEALLPTDLISPGAFVYFERPLYIPDRHGHRVNVKAFSYCPIVASPDSSEPASDAMSEYGVALSLYSSTRSSEVSEDDSLIEEIEKIDDRNRARGLKIPRLTMLHLTPIWFGINPAEEEIDVDTGLPTGAHAWWKLFQTTMRLAQQQMCSHYRERPDRSNRRTAARAHFDEREVVVVRLRREQGESRGEPIGDANYSHRFIVSGHWRNQWYPASAVHRQIWISPYVKGPDDAPLMVRPKRAFTWVR